MDKQDDYALRWRKLENNHTGHISGKTIICGHTEQRDGQVLFQNGIICIDTWAYGEGCLTTLELEHKNLYQADNKGDFYITDVKEFF